MAPFTHGQIASRDAWQLLQCQWSHNVWGGGEESEKRGVKVAGGILYHSPGQYLLRSRPYQFRDVVGYLGVFGVLSGSDLHQRRLLHLRLPPHHLLVVLDATRCHGVRS